MLLSKKILFSDLLQNVIKMKFEYYPDTFNEFKIIKIICKNPYFIDNITGE